MSSLINKNWKTPLLMGLVMVLGVACSPAEVATPAPLEVDQPTGNTGGNTGGGGDLLYVGETGEGRPVDSGKTACIEQDPANPLAVNFNSLYYFGDFLVNSNPWQAYIVDYPYEQCIHAQGDKPGWTFDWGSSTDTIANYPGSTWQPQPWNVRSFPEVIYGVKRGGTGVTYEEASHGTLALTKEKTGLPVRVDQIPDMYIDLDYSTENLGDDADGSGDQNVAIESFFHESANCDSIRGSSEGSNMKYEIMLWLEVGDHLPEGLGGYVGDTVIDGIPVEIWTKDGNNLHYLTFLVKAEARTTRQRTIHWSKFIEFARDNGHRLTNVEQVTLENRTGNGTNRRQLDGSYCLANVIVGTEIWNGSGNFTLNSYKIRQLSK